MGKKTAVLVAAGAVTAVLAGEMTPAAAATSAAATQVPCSTQALARAVSGAASGATLSLARDCTYVLTAALPAVARNLTIDGNGSTLRRSEAPGTAAFTILTINAGAVTLNQLSFVNGNGAITLNDGATLAVTGGAFRGNKAANGGAINNTGATVAQVTGASFIDNTATESGGAIYIYTALGDAIVHCIFRGNTTAGQGGAIYDYSVGTEIAGSTFLRNKAGTGGALFLDDNTGASVTTTTVEDNSATGAGGGIVDGPGGEPSAISDSKIIGNRAGGPGGGLDEEEVGGPSGSITNTLIERNDSAADGGGINDAAAVFANYTGDTISDNNARGEGGGINAIASILNFTKTTISGNQAGQDGGGVANMTGPYQQGVSSFTNSTISQNRAQGSGGGLYNQQSLQATGTRIIGNLADGGGGIFDEGPYTTVTLSASSPASNEPDNCEPVGSIPGCAG